METWRAAARETIKDFLWSIKKSVSLISEPASELVGLVRRALPTFLFFHLSLPVLAASPYMGVRASLQREMRLTLCSHVPTATQNSSPIPYCHFIENIKEGNGRPSCAAHCGKRNNRCARSAASLCHHKGNKFTLAATNRWKSSHLSQL